MKKVVIVGTGAVAAELTSYIKDENSKGNPHVYVEILGYLEYEQNIEKYWSRYQLEYPVICNIDDYIPESGVDLIMAISNIAFRNKAIAVLKSKGATFINYIHSSVIIPADIKIGEGNIVYPFCVIGPMVDIGNFNLITSFSFISHNSTIGSGNFLATAGLAGHVIIGNNNYFGIRSTVLPDVVIGDYNTVQAGMIVDKNVADHTTVFYRYKEQILAIPQK